MSADELVRSRQDDWQALDHLLSPRLGHKRLNAEEVLELARLYRGACGDAARARANGADDATLAYLDALLARAHNALYRSPPPPRRAILRFLREGFPQALRKNGRYFAVASAAFYGPWLFGLLAALLLPGFAAAVMGPMQVELFREMYRTAPDSGRSLGEGGLAVSFYVQHNTTIAFNVFASGIFVGLGSVFMLAYQGLVLGTVFGLLIGDDKAYNVLTFTCGHSAWELTAIVVAGAAGLRMGYALVDTGGRTRLGSLRHARNDVTRLVLGAAVLLAVAAAIEGIWSPSILPAPVKWAFAVLQVGVVATYLARGGRPAEVRT